MKGPTTGPRRVHRASRASTGRGHADRCWRSLPSAAPRRGFAQGPRAPRDGGTLPEGPRVLGDPAGLPPSEALPSRAPGDGPPYLNLLNLVLNPLDGVAVDVIAGVHLLPADHLGPDHCEAKARR